MRLHTLSLLGYCVVVIDSRGSDYRGLEFDAHIKHKMVLNEFLKVFFLMSYCYF